MRSLLMLVLAIVFVAVMPHSYADQAHIAKQKSCVYRFLACKDRCDQYQDEAAIAPCKRSCDKAYRCRPPARGKYKG